jgi:hypothetical protein
MTHYEHAGQHYAVIDGELYVKLAAALPAHAPVAMAQSSAAPKTEKKVTKGKRLGAEAKETIRKEIAAGASMPEICKKYGISSPTYYNIKKTLTTPEPGNARAVSTYQCVKGHRFQSTLPQSQAICPDCRSKAFRKLSDEPVTELLS